jgi:adenosyl cobinamide kinase/adenosyl cobinamide phosphate guanylyltransferase
VITLVLGGARSGKSAVAERLAARQTPPVTYLATAIVTPDDPDFSARVEAHRRRRPETWRTVETGTGLVAALSDLPGTAIVDALGTWVASAEGFDVDVDGLCSALKGRSGHTVIVSDEVGLGVHPSTDAGRRFRDALGAVNQAVAELADEVVLVVAGRILRLERA